MTTFNKLTESLIRQKISKMYYSILEDGRTTLCTLILQNGFTVVGKSPCVDPSNFNMGEGQKYAFEDALNQVWPLEGYLLKEKLYQGGLASQNIAIHEGSDFGFAIRKLRAGKKVTRRGWNGKGMWLSMSGVPGGTRIEANRLWSKNNCEYADDQPDGKANVLPCITMKTASGDIMMGWAPSQEDMFANDWCIVE